MSIKRISIILDNSFVLQSLMSKKSDNFDILKELVKKNIIQICLCNEAVKELKDSMEDSELKQLLKERQRRLAEFMAWYKYNSTSYKITNKHKLQRDPNDSFWLNLIDASQAKFLITNDKDLLTLKDFQDCKFLKFPEFLNQMQSKI